MSLAEPYKGLNTWDSPRFASWTEVKQTKAQSSSFQALKTADTALSVSS